MKLFYLLVSAVVLTTNPLFAMDPPEPYNGQGLRMRKDNESFSLSVAELQRCLKLSKKGVGSYPASSTFVDSDICQITLTDAAKFLLTPVKNEKIARYCHLSESCPDLSNLVFNNIKLHPDERVLFAKEHFRGNMYHFRAKLWKNRDFNIILTPLEYAEFRDNKS